MGGGGGGLGTIAGGVGGFLLGGPAGAAAGASMGGALGGMLGGGTDAKYTAQGVPLQTPTTNQMVDDQYNRTNANLDQQRAFVNSLGAQNGIGNQNAAFAMAQNQANGMGPNPAQAQLAQNTAANTANQAALMAGQRGASSNPALIARQAAMQGAQNQQGAIGQAATLGAQQQLAGQQMMANMAQQQIANQQAGLANYGQQSLANYGQASGNVANQNNAALGMQSNINNVNAQLAGGNQTASNNMLGNIMGAAGSVAGMMGKGGGGSVNAVGAGGGSSMANGTGMLGTGSLTFAEGGGVPQMAEGGLAGAWDSVVNTVKDSVKEAPKKPKVEVKDPDKDKAKGLSSVFNTDKYAEGGDVHQPMTIGSSPKGPQSNVAKHMMNIPAIPRMAHGGKVPALVSPGETYLKPQDVEKVAKGANPLKEGERIPGKPKVKGNSYQNDTVSKDLDEGGIVIPNSIMQSKDAEKKAAAFVKAILAKQGLKK